MNNIGAAPITTEGTSVNETTGPQLSQMEKQDKSCLWVSELFCKMEDALQWSLVQ